MKQGRPLPPYLPPWQTAPKPAKKKPRAETQAKTLCMTIDRSQFLPPKTSGGDFPVPLNQHCSVPSEHMAYLMAES